MQIKTLVRSLMLAGLASPLLTTVYAQAEQRVEITGSSIKRIASEGSLPVQIITREQLEAQGIVSAEQVVSALSINANGLDNLASNADVVAGAARGNNGASCANLRGQGCAATLVLLNGRRVAAHGLNGGTVDLNTIPFAAIERIELLKDGASAIYGTDAIGGVINFILRNNFRGLEAQAFVDIPQEKGGEIYRAKLTAGFGDLERDKFNVLFALSLTDNKVLRGDQRDFVNTFQPLRGLSVDTRGTPYATIFALTTLYSAISRDNINTTGRGAGPTLPGGTQAYNGINVLDLPGQAGCKTVDGQDAYDEVLWATPAAKYGCAWDTGRAAVLQQPVKNTNFVLQGNLKLGEHMLHGEYVGGKSESAKTFSANQISSSTSATSPFFNLAYPSTGASYNTVFNALVGTFPQLEANRGRPLAFRWRCLPCGSRQIDTESDTSRALVSLDGPIAGGWDYKVGFSTAESKTSSLLGDGYFYGNEFAALINNGILNPFLPPGQAQSDAAIAGLKAVSANGVTLYGGKYTVIQSDAIATGPIFKLGGAEVMAAVGVNVRTEKFRFNGNETDLATQARIFNAPFDSINTLNTVKRDIKAVFGEVLVPITKRLELTVAARRDDYTGFGTTTNPKVSLRFTPIDQIVTRASYNTGFRVPTFNQLFFGITQSTYAGKDLVDPGKCAGTVVDPSKVGCESITPILLSGGKPELGPEESKQWTAGFVFAPNNNFSFGADWWSIRKTGTIQTLSLAELVANYKLFESSFFRDASGTLQAVDTRYVNAGESITRGVDVNAQVNGNVAGGKASVAFEGTYLLEKKSRLIANQPFGASEVGRFTRAGDLGLRWKHSIVTSYTQGDWTATGTYRYRSGYLDAVLPGVANGSVVPPQWKPNVDSYELFDVSLKYRGIKNLGLTFGIKNLLDKDPPFSAAYDSNTGAGSSWEPRVADPRGRSFTFTIDYKFF